MTTPQPTKKDMEVSIGIITSNTPPGEYRTALFKLFAQALAAQRLETRDVIIQILNDYPDITVGDLARIKNEIYNKFPDALLAKLGKEDKYK